MIFSKRWKKAGFFLVLMAIFLIAGNLVSFLIFNWKGIDITVLQSLKNISEGNISILKWTSMINHLIIFTLSSLVWIFLFFRRDPFSLKKPDVALFFYFIFWLILSYPLIAYGAQLNQLIPIPAWAEEMDNSSIDFLIQLLKMDNIRDLFINLLVIAVIPAIGEELLFRGVILRELLGEMKNGHLAVLVTSILFAFFHLQLSSFLPKFIIGLILSYSFFWTRNLWYPVLIHFINNGFQVMLLYFSDEEINEAEGEVIPAVPLLSVIISAILCAVIVDTILKRIRSAYGRV